MVKNIIVQARSYGSGFSNWLQLYSDFICEFYEIAIVGDNANAETREILEKYIPNKLIASSRTNSHIPLLKDRFIVGKTLIYTCIDGACLLPNEDVEKSLKRIKINFKR